MLPLAAEVAAHTTAGLPCPAALTGTFHAKGVLRIPHGGLQAGEARLKHLQAPFSPPEDRLNLVPARGSGCSVLEHSQAQVTADVSSRVVLEDVAAGELGDGEIGLRASLRR